MQSIKLITRLTPRISLYKTFSTSGRFVLGKNQRLVSSNRIVSFQSQPFIRSYTSDSKAEETTSSDANAAQQSNDNAAAGDAAKEAELDPVQAELQSLKAELQETKEALQYAIAERENVRRIMLRDVQKAKDFGIKNFAVALLDVSDNFERALEASKEASEQNEQVKQLYDGVLMTEKQLHNVFDKFGIERFRPEGEKFDPNQHNALMEMPHESLETGHVGVVIKSGFRMKDVVLRPADVGITKN